MKKKLCLSLFLSLFISIPSMHSYLPDLTDLVYVVGTVFAAGVGVGAAGVAGCVCLWPKSSQKLPDWTDRLSDHDRQIVQKAHDGLLAVRPLLFDEHSFYSFKQEQEFLLKLSMTLVKQEQVTLTFMPTEAETQAIFLVILADYFNSCAAKIGHVYELLEQVRAAQSGVVEHELFELANKLSHARSALERCVRQIQAQQGFEEQLVLSQLLRVLDACAGNEDGSLSSPKHFKRAAIRMGYTDETALSALHTFMQAVFEKSAGLETALEQCREEYAGSPWEACFAIADKVPEYSTQLNEYMTQLSSI